MAYTSGHTKRPPMQNPPAGCGLAPPQNKKSRLFEITRYILAGAIAGVVVAGVIEPLLGLNAKEVFAILGAVIGALSAGVIKAFHII